jgi:hypothetical protein
VVVLVCLQVGFTAGNAPTVENLSEMANTEIIKFVIAPTAVLI